MIRAYRPSDLDQLYEICVRTGASGEDAYDLVEDKKLFGHVFAAQYGLLEPEHAFVIDDGSAAWPAATSSARSTRTRSSRSATPSTGRRCRRSTRQGSGEGLDAMLIGMIHNPSHMPRAITGEYPSHLHIDLLPTFQGGGWGRRLMEHLLDVAARRRLARACTLASAANNGRSRFYEHLGFTELHANPMVHVLGIKLKTARPRSRQVARRSYGAGE